MSALAAYVEGVGLLGPGLTGWSTAAPVLAGRTSYVWATTVMPAPSALPAAERRRSGLVVKLALGLGFEASGHASRDPATLATVFSSSGGDGHNCHEICQALASADRQLSPTRFHNSVHNAAAGYWSIATGSMAPSTVLCAYDASFAAGLLEALAQVVVVRNAVMLLAYDAGYPAPLHAKRPIHDAFGVALVLTVVRSERSIVRLNAELSHSAAELSDDPQLERLRSGVPAARSLPLLSLLARQQAGAVHLEYFDSSSLRVEITPC